MIPSGSSSFDFEGKVGCLCQGPAPAQTKPKIHPCLWETKTTELTSDPAPYERTGAGAASVLIACAKACVYNMVQLKEAETRV